MWFWNPIMAHIMIFSMQNGWPTMRDLLSNDPIHRSHLPASLHYNITEQTREARLGHSRISHRRLENLLQCSARIPPPYGEWGGGEGGEVMEGELLKALVEEVATSMTGCSGTKRAPDPKMLLPPALTISLTQSKNTCPVIRYRRCVLVKGEPQWQIQPHLSVNTSQQILTEDKKGREHAEAKWEGERSHGGKEGSGKDDKNLLSDTFSLCCYRKKIMMACVG